jgi:hypothetical protein
MADIRRVTHQDVPLEDQAQLLISLRQWRDEGNPNPLIPTDVDVDGDGVVDAFGLDDAGQLVYVSGASLADTVMTADQAGEGDE